jgi:phosphate acetyltransferase
MTFAESMIARAKSTPRPLVLPEGTEPRTLRAARRIVDEGIASVVTLVGALSAVRSAAEHEGVALDGIQVVDPATSADRDPYAEELHRLRKHKGMTLEVARTAMANRLHWGAMMVNLGAAHSMVAGAETATADVLRAALPIIRTAPGTRYASSCFVMVVPGSGLGSTGSFIFSDCATIPDPTDEQLAEIAIAAASSCRALLQTEPVVALLSFSTKGSASHPSVDKVLRALEIVRTRSPTLRVDGELQADAALVASVGSRKAPGSPVAGAANTLVFPNLDAANIGYKLVQRLARAEAYGPFLQGFAKPVSDLSRGCSVEEIVVTAAVTLVQ